MTEYGILPVPTLGERLDAQGRHHLARLLFPLPWARPLRVFIDRVAELTADAGRFDRIESAPDRPFPLTAAAPLRRPRTAIGLHVCEPSAAAWPENGPAGDPAKAPTAPSPSPMAPPAADTRQKDTRQTDARHSVDDALPAESGTPGHGHDDLPAAARSRLRTAVGPAAEAIRVHHDDRADTLARDLRADAVTLGRDVYFRHGRLSPQDSRGFALLVHEATHVMALLRPGASWRRATGAGIRAEEAEALANERAAVSGPLLGAGAPRRPAARTVPARTRPAPLPATAPAAPQGPIVRAPAAPATQAMRAATDRTTATADVPPPVDVQALKRDLVDDLMRQLRSEFERGG
ncbi:DUF4157 domain-containing protein [Streptomyces sp. NPDC052109]|uniref:eCIS core domain-containing protein n=1 Tax=Streptomyces sp. NPDC052109 TaxID=3155527 RepID=UPI0034188B31